jgi:dCMP deaminase
MSRPSLDETWLEVARVLARRGTCIKAQVGCVLTDKRGNQLSTGWNGVARDLPHCNHEEMVGAAYQVVSRDPLVEMPTRMEKSYPHACAGATAPPGSDLCEALHAEQNALTRCSQPDAIFTCYLWRLSPCMRCTKQLLNTSCRRIVFAEEYAREPQARKLWEKAGREWIRGAAQDARDSQALGLLGLEQGVPYKVVRVHDSLTIEKL